MRPRSAVAILVALGCAGVAVLGWHRGAQPEAPRDAPAGITGEAAERPSAVASRGTDERTVARGVRGAAEGLAPAPAARGRDPLGAGAPATHEGTAAVAWPVTRSARSSGPRAAASGEPAVAAEVAFRALRYVGIDRDAERTWKRAIDDPSMPEDVRSDLIEDLNQEGYTDNDRPTSADLPLIRARLELIERLAPHAVDAVNSAAFEEAYKDLLEMYVRLGGEPRSKPR